MKPINCKNCASMEFSSNGFYLKCDYCGTVYDLDLRNELMVIEVLRAQGFTIENRLDGMLQITHPNHKDGWICVMPPLDEYEYTEILRHFKSQ